MHEFVFSSQVTEWKGNPIWNKDVKAFLSTPYGKSQVNLKEKIQQQLNYIFHILPEIVHTEALATIKRFFIVNYNMYIEINKYITTKLF